MNKAIFSILLLFTACTQPEKSAKKWVKEAKCIDSVKIVSPHIWADIETFKIKGFTLQQVKKLYGNYNYIVYENIKINGPEDIPDEDFSSDFVKSDYPTVISVYDWFRHPVPVLLPARFPFRQSGSRRGLRRSPPPPRTGRE